MSRKSRDEYLEKMRERYARMTARQARGKLLDEFCLVTGHERKYARPNFSERSVEPPLVRPDVDDRRPMAKRRRRSSKQFGRLVSSLVGNGSSQPCVIGCLPAKSARAFSTISPGNEFWRSVLLRLTGFSPRRRRR